MKPAVPAKDGDLRVTVLLILAVTLVLCSRPGGSGTPLPTPAFRLAADGSLYRVPGGTGAAGRTEPLPWERGGQELLPPRIALFFDRPVRINRAGHATLTMLPGIGPRLADRILAFRTDHGPITSTADLRQINGIGPELAAHLAPLLSFR